MREIEKREKEMEEMEAEERVRRELEEMNRRNEREKERRQQKAVSINSVYYELIITIIILYLQAEDRALQATLQARIQEAEEAALHEKQLLTQQHKLHDIPHSIDQVVMLPRKQHEDLPSRSGLVDIIITCTMISIIFQNTIYYIVSPFTTIPNTNIESSSS